MNLKEWTGSKAVSVVMLTITAAIVLALDAVVLFIGFGDGNIANLDKMDFAAIKGLFSSLVAGDVGKGLSIFSWVCVDWLPSVSLALSVGSAPSSSIQ